MLHLATLLFSFFFVHISGDSLTCGAAHDALGGDCVWASTQDGVLKPSDPRCTRLKSEQVLGHNVFSIATALQNLPELRELHLELIHLGDLGAQSIATVLASGTVPMLERLYMAHNDIGVFGAVSLARALSALPELRVLNLPENAIRFQGAEAFCNAFEQGWVPKLEQLVLAGNGIGTVGAVKLAQSLRHLPRLQDLHLARNGLNHVGAAALSSTLQQGHARSLEWLSLSENNIGDVGAQTLAKSLEMTPALEWLELQHNGVGDAGAMALSKALLGTSRRISLRELDLRGNEVGSIGHKSLEAVRQKHPEFQFWIGELASTHSQGKAQMQVLTVKAEGNSGPEQEVLRFHIPHLGTPSDASKVSRSWSISDLPITADF